MKLQKLLLIVWLGAVCGIASAAPVAYQPSTNAPPAPLREFRAAWVATVNNIDWPSRPGLPVTQQKAELLNILDHAAQLHLNALVFQVRPASDALYASKLEPWSEFLSGHMGVAPRPFYDPLQFAVEESHKRGLELHAWFNPFRARYSTSASAASIDHILRAHPELVRHYGRETWLDPGEPLVQEHFLRVVLDVLRRYDVDGIHLDDYFYPYPQKDVSGRLIEFPDSATYRKYTQAGGKLARDDWRRENINRFVRKIYAAIKNEKAHVKFGISPFGIWRPGFPQQIRGFDPYAQIYADSRKWLTEGWVDYFVPQLYWAIDAKEQSYPVLLKWWREQNVQQRHIWPGNSISRVGPVRKPEEIVNQVKLTREQSGPAAGNVFWNFKPLLENRGGIFDLLQKGPYSEPALVPASPWLANLDLPAPHLEFHSGLASSKFSWKLDGVANPWLWLCQTRHGDKWSTEVLPADHHTLSAKKGAEPDIFALTPIDRCGNAGKTAIIERPPRTESAAR